MNMIMYRWIQDKEDWKGFTSYEGMRKLVKVHKDENQGSYIYSSLQGQIQTISRTR